MSIVTRGLSRPEALLPSMGLGLGTTVIVICPVEQSTSAVEALVLSGVDESSIRIEALSLSESTVAVSYEMESTVLSPIQRTSLIDRLINIQVVHPELDVTVSEISQISELVEILQTATIVAPEMTIRIIEYTGEVDVREALDKVVT